MTVELGRSELSSGSKVGSARRSLTAQLGNEAFERAMESEREPEADAPAKGEQTGYSRDCAKTVESEAVREREVQNPSGWTEDEDNDSLDGSFAVVGMSTNAGADAKQFPPSEGEMVDVTSTTAPTRAFEQQVGKAPQGQMTVLTKMADEVVTSEAAVDVEEIQSSSEPKAVELPESSEAEGYGEQELGNAEPIEDPKQLAASDADTSEHGFEGKSADKLNSPGTKQGTKTSPELDIRIDTFEPEAPKVGGESLRSPSQETSSPSMNLVEVMGRQAFARAAAVSGTSPDVDLPSRTVSVEDLAEQIAEVRGSMSSTRARIVVGEGDMRVALQVQLKHGVVHIDARAADASVAQTFSQERLDLASALAKHGLQLGDLQTSADGGGELAQDTEKESSSTSRQKAERVPQTKADWPGPAHRGVRVVA